MVLGIIFKIAIHLKDRHIFMPQSQEILNVSNTLPLKKKKKLKIKNHFQKAGVMFLIKSTKIENIIF